MATKLRLSKKGDREFDQIEQLEKEIRELKAINRSLLKQLKKISKGIYKEEYEAALEKKGNVKEKERRLLEPGRECCPDCLTERLIETRVAGRLFRRCETCGWKSGLVK